MIGEKTLDCLPEMNMLKLISAFWAVLGSGSDQGNREDPGGPEVRSSREFSRSEGPRRADTGHSGPLRP